MSENYFYYDNIPLQVFFIIDRMPLTEELWYKQRESPDTDCIKIGSQEDLIKAAQNV